MSVHISFEGLRKLIESSDRTGQEEWRVVDRADIQPGWVTIVVHGQTLVLGREYVEISNDGRELIDIRWMPIPLAHLPRMETN